MRHTGTGDWAERKYYLFGDMKNSSRMRWCLRIVGHIITNGATTIIRNDIIKQLRDDDAKISDSSRRRVRLCRRERSVRASLGKRLLH